MSSIRDNLVDERLRKILVVSESNEILTNLGSCIKKINFSMVSANNPLQALAIFDSQVIAYVLLDINMSGMASDKFISLLRKRVTHRNTPIIVLASGCEEQQLSSCVDAGCDDFLFMPFNSFTLNARITSLEQIRDLEFLYKDSMNEQLVAMRILNSALEERSIDFEEITVLSQSTSVFSGDLFLTARHPDGSLNILMADFTGHGLSAAIGALPVADVFSVMTQKGFDLGYILENINNKLYTLLPTSMFMACSVLNISKDLKRVKVWNGGMPDIYIRAFGTGQVSHKIKSSHIPLGIDKKILNRFELESINLSIGDQFILYTDGLIDALDENNNMFGEHRLDQCLQINKNDESIFSKLVASFNGFCGDVKPMDDVTLACVSCTTSLMQKRVSNTAPNTVNNRVTTNEF